MTEIDIVNSLKDWGSLVISCLTLLFGVIGYFYHDRKLKLQEKRLNDFQIKQFEKEEAVEKMADMRANIVHNTRGNAKIKFVNAGKADATNVRINILTPKEELNSLIYDESWGPYDLINPQTSREERLAICEGCPNVIKIHVTWDDAFQKDRYVILSVFI